jgi:hypothetical protein
MTAERKLPPFVVELWDERNSRVEQVLAGCGRVEIAHWAYDVAVRAFPGRIIMLRNGALLVRESGPENCLLKHH